LKYTKYNKEFFIEIPRKDRFIISMLLVGLKLNGAYRLLAYANANDVNLWEDNIGTIKKKTATLIDTSKDVGLKIKIEKTEYMWLALHQIAGQNRDIKVANR
jgi:hypothetical protein